jgi:hypothetical protein
VVIEQRASPDFGWLRKRRVMLHQPVQSGAREVRAYGELPHRKAACSDERTVPRDYEHRLQAAASKKKLSLRLLPLGLKGELSLGTVAARHHAQDWVAVPDDLGTVPANLGSVAPT